MADPLQRLRKKRLAGIGASAGAKAPYWVAEGGRHWINQGKLETIPKQTRKR